ncbi:MULTISPECIES: Gp37 family protein [Neisseria]|uniref:Putative phage associated protein n=2 Tax=Neisseria TaxID=482 RepID=A0A3S5B306_9NEIS|nr:MULTISPECIES: Gp37 family protein [Neisseria]EGV38447.1 gp37 protein [Neisseria weaveri LMG 5135]SUA36346.1 putative phage associated protein [Neisseria zoodegmatis]VEJ50002.1 putative phage associated protein [Neisseria weaveri]
MAATVPILQAVTEWLQEQLPDAEVRLFPDNPATYRFIHPRGAVLVGYQGSKFGSIEQLGAISQQRVMTLHLTVFGRGLHNDGAALDLLDRLRLAVVGYQPPACLPCHLISEQFLSEDGGAWQYQLLVQTETHQVQQCREEKQPLFVAARYRQNGDPTEPDLKPKKE